jgi:YfiR/HmsC-like
MAQALICGVLGMTVFLRVAGGAEAPTEYQVKAVFVYNFSRFVEWPPQAFTAPNEPFVIGILGSDPFGARLDEAVRGEQIDQHPLVVRRFRNLGEISDCRILYIDRSARAEVQQVLAALDHRSTLTVSDLDGAAERGVMIQFTTENNRIRLRINVESARAAGLTISSKLLRSAEIVGARGGS